MADQKLTQRNAITETADDSLIHVVAGGSSYKTTKANFLSNVPGYSPNNVSAVWTGTGNIFDVTADSYQVDGNTYSSAPGQVTLDVSDPILDRIDLIIAIAPVSPDTIGTVGKITGTPATLDLVVPPDYDPALVFPIKQVTIKADSGVPFKTTKEIVFNEGTEWVFTPLAPPFTLVTNDPYTGTKSIYANGASVTDKLKFTSATAFNSDYVDLLEFYVKSDNVGFDYINLVCQFQLAGVLVGRVGTWITDPQPNDWNRVQINKEQLSLLGETYDELVFYCSSPSGGANFWIDNIAIFEGSGADNANLNISQFINDVPYLRDGSNTSDLVNDGENGTSKYKEIIIPTDIRVIPDSVLPSTTQDVVVECKDMTSDSTVSFGTGLTINSQAVELNKFGSFVVKANVTLDATEQTIDVIVNNGLIGTGVGLLNVVNGTAYIPTINDWTELSISAPDISQTSKVISTVLGTNNSAVWDGVVDETVDFVIKFNIKISSLGLQENSDRPNVFAIKQSGGTNIATLQYQVEGFGLLNTYTEALGGPLGQHKEGVTGISSYTEAWEWLEDNVLPEFRWNATSGELSYWRRGEQIRVFPSGIGTGTKLWFDAKYLDLVDIQYIDLSSATAGESYNDNYLATGDNISELVNDAGYLTNYIADKIVYIDAIDGDDLTGELSNIDKPFKTDVGAFNALPAYEGYSFFWTFKWIRTSGYNSPITITPHNLTRGIRYECDVTGRFEIDYQSNTYKEIWFDMPMCTISHNNGLGGTYSPVTLEYNAVSRKVAYINCQNYYNDSSRNFFILGTLHCQVIIENAYTSGPFLSDGTIRIANWDLNAGNMFDSGQGDKINIEIQNLTLNGQVAQLGLVSPTTLPKFPFKKILGTGGISTTNIRNADVTDLSVASGITIHHASPSILTGTMGEEFDGSVRYYNQAKIRNYNGYINAISGSNAYGIGYDIEDSIIKLTGGLISGNPSFNWVDTVWNWKNVTFVSDNPASTLISNYNALTLVTINAYGNISSNIGLSAISGLTYVNHTLEQNPRITDIGVATTYDFDHELATDWKLTMTADTTFTESNLPIRNNTIEFTFKLTGAFTPTFPTYWDVLGDAYDGAVWNFIAVQIHNGNSGSEEVTVFITNIA